MAPSDTLFRIHPSAQKTSNTHPSRISATRYSIPGSFGNINISIGRKRLEELVTHHQKRLPACPEEPDVSFWNRPNGLEKSLFQATSFSGSNTRTLLSDRFGGDYLWSPDGEKVLVSSTQEKGTSKITLATINKNGGEFRSLVIPTIVSKAAWSLDGKILYYALPGSLPDNVVLPNDYFSKKLLTADTFWKLDFETGKRERLMEGSEIGIEFDSTDLFLSMKGDALYFLNRRDGKTYQISL
jgi:Tol biopolymer transport system component